MTEQTADDPSPGEALPAAEPAGAPVTPPATAGTLLRQARERTGLHIAALAVSLKVPVRKLEALESDRYHLLTDAVFTRALAASVCRALKLDPAPVMALLPAAGTPRLGGGEDSLNAPFRGPDRLDGGNQRWLTRPAFIAAAVLVVAAGVLVLVPGPRPEAGRDLARPGGAAPLPSAAVEPPPPLMQPVPESAAAPASAAVLPPTIPVQAASTPTAAIVPPTPQAASSGLRGAVRFSTSGPSWIEVVDATGSITLRRVVGPNELAEVAGQAPLRITVGSASSTRVEVRGRPMDLAPVTRDNVARFEVQ